VSTAVCANGGLWRSATMKQRVLVVWFRVHFGHQRLTRLCRRMTRSGHLERGRVSRRVYPSTHKPAPSASAGARPAVRRSARLMSEGPQIYLVPRLVGC
jgi:hypothetical protein